MDCGVPQTTRWLWLMASTRPIWRIVMPRLPMAMIRSWRARAALEGLSGGSGPSGSSEWMSTPPANRATPAIPTPSSTRSRSSSCSSRASDSVRPTIGMMPGKIRISSGPRPYFAMRACMSSRKARPSLIVSCAVKTRSAVRAASSIPTSDEPACATTGRPCGERATFNGPRTLKYCPLWRRMCILSKSNQTPLALSRRKASSSQLSHRPTTTSWNSAARS